MEEFAANLPKETVILDLPDAQKYTQDGRPLKYIGTDLIRLELVREPARVNVKKYADALPLYRQEQIWKRPGVNLKRNTMANWVVLAAENYLKPFSDTFLSELL